MEDLIKKTETMLRAVLISSPRGVPLYRLDREYRSITFEPIPYAKCGFRNLEEFLYNIPKVARIQKDRDGETVVMGVPSEADQHVAKLIAKQKKPKIRKSAARPARRPVMSTFKFTPAKPHTSRFGPRSVRTEKPSYLIPKLSTSSTVQSGPSSRPSQTPRFVPPRLRKILGWQPQTDNKQPSTGTQRIVTFGSSDDYTKKTSKPTKKPALSKGMTFDNMEISSVYDPPAESPTVIVNIPGTQSNSLSPEVLERIGQIAGKNSNGFFLTRLSVLYKEKYQTDLPDNVAELLLSHPNTLRIEKTANIYIAYPPKINQAPALQVNAEETSKPNQTRRKVIELFTVKPYRIPVIGTPVEVYVSHVESTSDFYVHYKDSEEELNILLEKLHVDIKDITDCISTPSTGMYCCAQFSVDGSWYRALILECVQNSHTVNVFYVDFGNHEMLPHTSLRHLRQEHVEVPQMAVHCSLHGARADDADIKDRLMDMLDKQSTMTVVERRGEVLMVQLTDDKGTDITATKVQPDITATKVQPDITATKVQPDITATKVQPDITATKVQPDITATKVQPDITATKVQPDITATKVQPDITATKVQPDITATKVQPDITATKVLEEDKGQPAAPVCIVDEDRSNPEPEPKPLKPFLKKKSVSIEQDKKIPERVVIPDVEFLDIMVSTVFSTDHISVMLYGAQHSDKLLALEISMMSYFAESSEEASSTPNAGEAWAILSSDLHPDEQFYRVKVLSINNQQALLEFLDYGDTRQAPVSALKTLPARFLDLPFQAFTISLHDIPKTKKPQVLDKLKHHVLGKPLVAEVIQRTQSRLDVEIYDTSTELDVNINEVMRSLIIPDEDLVPAVPKVGHQVEARVSHITDTGTVFVQIPGAGLNRLEELMTDITEHYSKSTKAAEFVSRPSVGHTYCAKCCDGSWYRAIILELGADRKVKVQCVDYGNTETLPRTALREPTKANEHLNLLPFQAIECQLHGLEKESWTAEKTAKMNELVSEDVILEVIKQDHTPIVKLYLTTEDDQHINILEFIQDDVSSPRTVLHDCTATEQTDKESSSQEDDQDDFSLNLPPSITLSRPWVDVTISDIVDPGHFMFQPLEMIQRLQDLNNEMSDHYKKVETDHLVSPRNGDLCAVRYDDGWYYRAVVKAVLSPQQICVLFIDYGNLGIHPSSDFRVLLDDFKQTPSIAVKGYLAGIQPHSDSGEWSDETKKRFEELTSWKMLVGSVDGDQYQYDFREEHKVPMNLFDTTTNGTDINIAEVLLNEGLARRT